MRPIALIVCFLFFGAISKAQPTVQNLLALKVVEKLSSKEMEGRRSGTQGNAKARKFLIHEFEKLEYRVETDTFYFERKNEEIMGVNISVTHEGNQENDQAIVVTAHYDHLGKMNNEIYFGADDNASGTGALVALASFLRENPTKHNIEIIALDAEEMGLRGAFHYVNEKHSPKEEILLNINMDMISQSEKKELYACGTYHYPFLKPIADNTADAFTGMTLKFGHDVPGTGGQDWSQSSDHFPFHQKEIPFIYFGVEDHPYYHKPDDTFDKIHLEFYFEVVNFITAFLVDVDKKLD